MGLMMRDCLILFASQALLYGTIAANTVVIAQGNYPAIAATDFAVASVNYFLIRRIATAPQNWRLWLAYALGGVAGSLAGSWMAHR